MPRKKRPTLEQKKKQNPQGNKGLSKYARKIAKRIKRSKKLGLRDTPTPILDQIENDQ